MKRLRLIYSFLIIFLLYPTKGTSQNIELLSDSLVCSIAMYRELYNEYKSDKNAFQTDFFQLVKEVSLTNSKIGINTKLEDIGLDSFTIFELIDAANQKYGVSISEEQSMTFTTVGEVYQIVRPKGDSIPLSLVYYPWRMAFESRQVHRVSIYDDGIGILTDMIELSTDSIQREIYLNELMNVYDVWCEYVDTINTKIDNSYSKTLILSEKARKYVDECMPLVYGVKRDSINKSNIMEPFAVKAYALLRDALYVQEHKEDLHYTIPLYYFPLTQASIAYHHGNKNTKAFEKQYHADFDTVDIRLSDLMAMESIDEGFRRAKIRDNYDNIKKSYNETCDMMDLGSATNWRELEPIYRNQLAEKRELWDFGIEDPDADFLDRIIRSLRNDSSDVRLEALECYVEYIVPRPAKGESVSEDKVDEYKKKRNTLINAYLKRERYDEAYPLLEDVIKIETSNIEKASLYYKRGLVQLMKKNSQSAASNFKLAVRLNPNYGDAYNQLALAYVNCKFSNNEYKDKLKYNLVVEVLQKAKNSIVTYANTTEWGKYNTADLNRINQNIEAYKTHYIRIDDFHGNALASKYNVRIGERYVYDEGVMRGESAIINVKYE